jgi:acetyltransferase
MVVVACIVLQKKDNPPTLCSGSFMIIRRLDPRTIAQSMPSLGTLLLDAVADGHSLGFVNGLDQEQLDAYWQGIAEEVGLGQRVLLAAERDGVLVGTIQLALTTKPSGHNRAEVQQLLVHCTVRRSGIGMALLQALEIEALALRRGLLFLDAAVGSGAERLVQQSGYERVGELPEYACSPNGRWHATAIYYKTLFTRNRR